jgi:hypothetical protein
LAQRLIVKARALYVGEDFGVARRRKQSCRSAATRRHARASHDVTAVFARSVTFEDVAGVDEAKQDLTDCSAQEGDLRLENSPAGGRVLAAKKSITRWRRHVISLSRLPDGFHSLTLRANVGS